MDMVAPLPMILPIFLAAYIMFVYLKRGRRERWRRARRIRRFLFLSRKLKQANSEGSCVSNLVVELDALAEDAWKADDRQIVSWVMLELYADKMPNSQVLKNISHSHCSELTEAAPSLNMLREFMSHYFEHFNDDSFSHNATMRIVSDSVFSGKLNVDSAPAACAVLTMVTPPQSSKILSRSDADLFLSTANDVMDAIGNEPHAKRKFAEALDGLSLDELQKMLHTVRYIRSRYDVEPDPMGGRVGVGFGTHTVMEEFCQGVLEATQARVSSRGVIMFYVLGHAAVAQALESMSGVNADHEIVARIVRECWDARMDEDAFISWIGKDGNGLRELVTGDGVPLVELWSALMPRPA